MAGLILEGKKYFRAILCNSQAKWEMKNFYPPPHAIRYCGGLSKNAVCSGCYFIVAMVTPIFCWWQKKFLNCNPKTVVKSAKCVALFLKSIKTLQPKT